MFPARGWEILVLDDDILAGAVPLTRHEQLSTSSASAVTLVSAPQATLEVTTLADIVDADDGLLSLREAVDLANRSPGADTVTFAEALRGGILTLTQGQLVVTDLLVVDGDPRDGGFDGITITTERDYPASRTFLVQETALELRDLTIAGAGTTEGRPDHELGDANGTGLEGGAVGVSDGSLVLERVAMLDNGSFSPHPDRLAGAIAALRSDITVADSLFQHNVARGDPQEGTGGILLAGGSLLAERTVFAEHGGTAISGKGTFDLRDVALVDNVSIHATPALSLEGTITIVDSLIRGSDSDDAPAISLRGEVSIDRSTITENFASSTPVEISNGTISITNSTIAANTFGDPFLTSPAGALRIEQATAEIINSTITGNHAIVPSSLDPGVLVAGGIVVAPDATLTLTNSLVLGNELALRGAISQFVAMDVAGAVDSGGGNILGQASLAGSVAGDQLGVDPRDVFADTRTFLTFGADHSPQPTGLYAGVLADNGGPTPTAALLDSASNPALDNADPTGAPATDQRGYLRDATPDIGAFELGGTPPAGSDTLPPLAEKVPLPDSEIHGAPLFLVGPSGDAEIAFVDEVAAFQSSLGVYLVGPDGTIGATSWAFERIEHADASADASAAARPGGGPLEPGDAVQLSDLFDPADLTPGTGFGLFLVANGWALNDAAIFEGGTLEFRAGGGPASVTDTVPDLVHLAAGGDETLVLGNILHTIDAGSPNPLSNTLNPGGTGQVTSGSDDGRFIVAFEDKPLNGGSDRDFNDALFAVEPLVTAEEVIAV